MWQKRFIRATFSAETNEQGYKNESVFSRVVRWTLDALIYAKTVLERQRFWVTFDKEDARSLLEGEKVYPCYYPTNRSLKALVKNTKIAWDVLHKEKPDLIISCGAAVAVPFFYIGKIMGAKVVYIEVFDRIDKPTMTGKMVYPITDKFIVQWDEQKKVYPKAVNLGSIF